MTTSGTYSFSVAATDIVRHAMLNVGAIGESEVATASEYTDCVFKLNLMVKQWMGKQDFAPGLKVWTRQRGDLFLGLHKFQYQLGPSGDNWAGSVTGGSVGQTYNYTTLSAAAIATATTVTVAAVSSSSISSTANVNIGDFIGIVCAYPTGADLFWTTVSNSVTGTITLNAGLPYAASANAVVFNYTVKQQRPLEIVTGTLRDIYSNDTQLNPMTVQDYEALTTKTMYTFQADPTAYLYESQIGTGTGQTVGSGQLYIDCGGAQDVTKLLHMIFLRPVQDLDNPGDNPEYPQQWYRALIWGLSRDIAGMFDATWTQDMQANFSESIAMAKEADAETTSFFFQRDSASPYDP